MRMTLEKRALDKLFRRRDRVEIPDFQRGEVWSRSKKQLFMDTIQRNWFVPVVFLRVIDDQSFECIDGQQRLNAIFGFYNNNYPLPKSSKYAGLFYKDLPDKVKDIFDDYELRLVEICDDEEGEVEVLFHRLQLGMPLNAGEKLNAVRGDMRDFLVELSQHDFLVKKVNIRNYRYAFLSICSQICLLELEGIQDAKYKDLESFYKKHGVFSNKSPKAVKVLKVFNMLKRMFDGKIPELSNRASVVSLYLLVSSLLEKTSLKGKELTIAKFYIGFLKKLRFEVEKGPLATDTELIVYQSAVNQAADSKEAIQRRQDILMKRLVKFDSTFEPYLEKVAINTRLAALQREKDLHELSGDFFSLVSECNNICSSKHVDEIFPPTNKMLERLSDVERFARNKKGFGDFIDAMYEIVYEGSGSLKRIPAEFRTDDFVGFDIKLIRTDFRHDIEHGDAKEIRRKKNRLASTYKKYTGKTSLGALGNGEFITVQLAILRGLRLFLQNLKQYCISM